MPRLIRSAAMAPILGAAMLGVVALAPGVAAGSTVSALWHMNETSGTVMADSSGNGNDGMLHNVMLGAAGKSGKSYTFGGSQVKSYVEVPNAASLNPGAANIDISFWLR